MSDLLYYWSKNKGLDDNCINDLHNIVKDLIAQAKLEVISKKEAKLLLGQLDVCKYDEYADLFMTLEKGELKELEKKLLKISELK